MFIAGEIFRTITRTKSFPIGQPHLRRTSLRESGIDGVPVEPDNRLEQGFLDLMMSCTLIIGLLPTIHQKWRPITAASKGWWQSRIVLIRTCVISACAKLQDLENVERTFAYALGSEIEFSSSLVNTLVDMYMKCETVEVAEMLFYECTDRNTVLWKTMLSKYAHLEMAQKIVALFNDVLISGLKPDRITIVAVASTLAQLGNEEAMTGRRIHGYVLRNKLDVSHDVCNSIIDLYMKCQELDSAFQVFNRMKQKTVASWNTIIIGCIKNGDWASVWKHFEEMPRRDEVSWNTMIVMLVQESWFEDAISFFREMLSSGMRPDTMVSIALACDHLSALDLTKWTYAYINSNKIHNGIKLHTALVDLFARCGDTTSSMKIFDKLPNRDVSAWTAAI